MYPDGLRPLEVILGRPGPKSRKVDALLPVVFAVPNRYSPVRDCFSLGKYAPDRASLRQMQIDLIVSIIFRRIY